MSENKESVIVSATIKIAWGATGQHVPTITYPLSSARYASQSRMIGFSGSSRISRQFIQLHQQGEMGDRGVK